MTVFTDNPDEQERLDLALLKNGSVHLYHRAALLRKDGDGLEAIGYQLDQFDCSRWETEDEMHRDLATGLSFPGYYGQNLDALNDCLSNLNISDTGRVLVFHRYDLFTLRFPTVAWHVLDIVDRNSWLHLLFGERLFALVQSDDPAIEFSPVGCRAAMWNPREWLQQNRSK